MEITISLLAIIIFQAVFYYRLIQKLTDKLMSRDFVEYKQAEAMDKQPKEKRIKIEDTAAIEDLGTLNGF